MSKSKNVMLIDDDPGILDAISIMLEYEGYNVRSITNDSDLMKMDTDLPDIILLDIWMSGIDGRAICKHLKQNPATAKLPVVLISASRDIEISAMQAGADDFLAKPFEMNDLLQKIERLTQ